LFADKQFSLVEMTKMFAVKHLSARKFYLPADRCLPANTLIHFSPLFSQTFSQIDTKMRELFAGKQLMTIFRCKNVCRQTIQIKMFHGKHFIVFLSF